MITLSKNNMKLHLVWKTWGLITPTVIKIGRLKHALIYLYIQKQISYRRTRHAYLCEYMPLEACLERYIWAKRVHAPKSVAFVNHHPFAGPVSGPPEKKKTISDQPELRVGNDQLDLGYSVRRAQERERGTHTVYHIVTTEHIYNQIPPTLHVIYCV